MAPNKLYANYPGSREADDCTYLPDEDHNPALRGTPLVVASTLLANFSTLQRWLYANTGFANVTAIPGLNDVSWRLSPNVIPIRDSSNIISAPDISGFDARQQPADQPGRFSSAADYYALYKSKTINPVDVVEALLPLIDRNAASPTEYSIAWLDVQKGRVLADAAASAARWAVGKPLSVLDGVPFGVKADINVEGFITTFGMRYNPALSFFSKAQEDTVWPVTKLLEAGAIMLGQLNMHEIGMDTTGCNPRTGTPINWYNKAYYPGGSSSGPASSLGAGLIPIAVATDAGGSIRLPACMNGVFGLKTTHSRTMVMNSSMCIVGPMAGTASDLRIAYRLMAQPDEEDPEQGIFAPSIRPSPSAKAPRYIGICKEWVARSAADVLGPFNAALEYMTTQKGYTVVDIEMPYLRQGQFAHSAICLAESADYARARVSKEKGEDWLELLNHANRFAVLAGAQVSAGDYLKFGQLRQVMMAHMAWLFEKYPGLLIVSPTMADKGYKKTPGDETQGFTDGNRVLRHLKYIWVANMTGCPAVTSPVGYVEEEEGKEGGGRLPVGLHAMAEWGEEERLLAWAEEGQKYLDTVYKGGRQRPKQGWVDVLELAKAKVGKTSGTTTGKASG